MTARLTTPGEGGYIKVGTVEINLNLTSADDNGFIEDLSIQNGGVRVPTDDKYNIHLNISFRHNTSTYSVADTITLFIRVNGNRDLVEQPFSYNNNKSNSFSVTTTENLKAGDVITCHAQASTDRSSLQINTARYFTYLLVQRQ